MWVAETRPRNQGSKLPAWELGEHRVQHTIIADSAAGHLMQRGAVDLVIVGTDRTTFTGDVANKIGTYLKALAAKDNDVPFYVALPSSSFDWKLRDGLKQIPIEELERGGSEASRWLVRGTTGQGPRRAGRKSCGKLWIRCYARPSGNRIDYRAGGVKSEREASARFFQSRRCERIRKVFVRMRGCGDYFVWRAC